MNLHNMLGVPKARPCSLLIFLVVFSTYWLMLVTLTLLIYKDLFPLAKKKEEKRTLKLQLLLFQVFLKINRLDRRIYLQRSISIQTVTQHLYLTFSGLVPDTYMQHKNRLKLLYPEITLSTCSRVKP